jgi:carbonic anhydrase/acetyltransferase-like protein (isoleucine patch superfamily)
MRFYVKPCVFHVILALDLPLKSQQEGRCFMAIYAFDGHEPVLPPQGDCFIAPSAAVIGKVRLAAKTSIWFGAVLRGDNEPIEVGEGSNIQDNAVCHTDPGFPLTIGAGVVAGHSVILHGCTIGDNVLVGMGATVMNGAVIGENAVIGAGALVAENKIIPPNSLVVGMPGKIIRKLTDEEAAALTAGAKSYAAKIPVYLESLKEL